jgi:hypothetical protein
MFDSKPTTEQIAALLAAPSDPDAMIRSRIERELRRVVNHAALFGLEAPQPEATEQLQIRAACAGVLPHRLREANALAQISGVNPYDQSSRQMHGGVFKGD